MTPYEAQSLEVAREALTASIVADVIAGIALVVAIVGGFFAYRTLRTFLAQIGAAQWSTLLSLEQDMAQRREKFFDINTRLRASPPPADIQDIQKEFNAAKENYFNAIDRFASLVLNGQFPQKELRQDYHDSLKEMIRDFPADFQPGSRYRKLLKLYDKWEDGN